MDTPDRSDGSIHERITRRPPIFNIPWNLPLRCPTYIAIAANGNRFHINLNTSIVTTKKSLRDNVLI